MLTVNIGPLVLPVQLAMLMAAVAVAFSVSHLIGRRQKTRGVGHILSDMLIAALLTARLAFVVTWLDLYRATPWAMLDIRDGGYTPWAGIGAALLVAAWHGWRIPASCKPLGLALASGVLAYGVLSGASLTIKNGPAALPATALTTLAGEPTGLARLADGKPLVVNLWASWCPPCRREMPLLAQAQKAQGDIAFVFVNQGEKQDIVQDYLSGNGINLSNVVLDRNTALGKAVGSMALPTTLFYDASGQLRATHIGELSAASLADKLGQLHEPAKQANVTLKNQE
ncbi:MULTISPECIES: TlpA disulfide reductase family protein [unclassified Janthinobacterium]|uniref:TlpA disulfide reductase family protein n=1 Tax=unclassified Janthinobacterium TaxID=2610881 RepID=UPI001615C002|nr:MULTISPECIES: TlpA disulfide reductase family protein [unclassified Janthinobacterium]MBB5605709.1 thiol-disulfide isomerase/thioredoxin [Janthinobacterium sp. S3T4]MBB5611372.1 thiol-disulfide isomerase/thioredoxin [Janthinobacterium sp. S3M3]